MRGRERDAEEKRREENERGERAQSKKRSEFNRESISAFLDQQPVHIQSDPIHTHDLYSGGTDLMHIQFFLSTSNLAQFLHHALIIFITTVVSFTNFIMRNSLFTHKVAALEKQIISTFEELNFCKD